MNKLSAEDRATILHLLCEGMSIRAITRTTGASKNTVFKLMVDAGKALAAYQEAAFVNLPTKRVQVDEIWSFTHAKRKNVADAKDAPEWAGDTWTWTAIDSDSKLVMSWLVGGRDASYAHEFIEDVYGRLTKRVQITSDGHGAYTNAVRDIFGIDVDYAQLVKQYGDAPESFKGRYSQSPFKSCSKRRIEGRPDPRQVSTSYVERQNLTMRMHMLRFTRLTNAFSKKIENHAHAVALHFAYYNFACIHKTLRVTPAMAAGVTDRLWEMSDLVAILDAAEAKQAKGGPYRRSPLASRRDSNPRPLA